MDVTCPANLLAGASDEIITSKQIFTAENLLGRPRTGS